MSDVDQQAPEADHDPVGPGDGAGAPETVRLNGAPAAAVLATVSTAYSASAARGAATALVHMLVEQGLFGYGLPFLDPQSAAEVPEPPAIPEVLAIPDDAADDDASPDTLSANLTAWDRARSAVAPAGSLRVPRAQPGAQAVNTVQLVEEIIRRAVKQAVPAVAGAELVSSMGGPQSH